VGAAAAAWRTWTGSQRTSAPNATRGRRGAEASWAAAARESRPSKRDFFIILYRYSLTACRRTDTVDR
jgi:hypothetical protein